MREQQAVATREEKAFAAMPFAMEWGDALRWQPQAYPWRPPTDVLETPEAFLIRLEVAGMRPEDFAIQVREHLLIIRGQRRDPLQGTCAYHQMEIRFGTFEVLVRLGHPVDVDAIEATYENGFLTLRLPKVRPTTITLDA